MQKRLFVYEPYATGHHIGFLRVLLDGLQEREDWHTTLLTTEDARSHPAFKGLAEKFESGLDVVVTRHLEQSSLAKRCLGSFYAEQHTNFKSLRRQFRALHHDRHFDFAFVPYLEAVGVHNLAFRACFGQVPWAVIPHGLRFHFRASKIKAPPRRIDALQKVCFLQMLRAPTLAAVFTLDPYLAKWANHPKVLYVPDPSNLPPGLDRRASCEALRLPEDAMIVLVYGAIDGRKCLDVLVPAMVALDQSQNVVLVVAGMQDPRIRRAFLEGMAAEQLRRRSRLFEFNRFVSTDEEQMLFTAADVIWTYNRDSFGSSGVLVRAGQYSKPVIVNDAGLAARIVEDERCGIVVASAESATVTQAIIELATQPALRRELGERAFARFSQNVPKSFMGPIAGVMETATADC